MMGWIPDILDFDCKKASVAHEKGKTIMYDCASAFPVS